MGGSRRQRRVESVAAIPPRTIDSKAEKAGGCFGTHTASHAICVDHCAGNEAQLILL